MQPRWMVGRQVAEAMGSGSHATPRWREMDSNFRFRASSDYAGVGVLRSTWAVLTLRRRDPDWNATKRRRDSERRATHANFAVRYHGCLSDLRLCSHRTSSSMLLRRIVMYRRLSGFADPIGASSCVVEQRGAL